MLVINRRSKQSLKQTRDKYLQQLAQRSQLERFYKNQQALRMLKLASQRVPSQRGPSAPASDPGPVSGPSPKQNLTEQDIERSLEAKLRPYMINNNELLAFISDLKAVGSLSAFEDLFELFRSKYLLGVSRLNNAGIQALYTSFVNRIR